MPSCLAPGCTIGYKSNHERVVCFSVPSDIELREKWQAALRRPQTLVKKQVVCEKHFLKSDIIREKILTADGRILGVSPLARPKLRAGAIPYWFPWTEVDPPHEKSQSVTGTMLKNCNDSRTEVVEDETEVSATSEAFNMSISFASSPEKVHACSSAPAASSTLSNLDNSSFLTSEPSEFDISNQSSAMFDENKEYTFKDLQDGLLSLPLSWTRTNISEGEKKWVVFSKIIFFKDANDNHGHSNILKELVIDSNLEMKIYALGKLIDGSSHGFVQKITSKRVLEEMLYLLHSLKVCEGCLLSDEIIDKNDNLTEKDCRGTVRHKNCELLTRSLQCRFCHTAKRTLIRREKRKNERPPSQLKPDFPKCSLSYVRNLRKKFNRKETRVKALTAENRRLKKDLEIAYKRMETMENSDVIEKLKNRNIPMNQQHLIEAILNAAKTKSPRGRRYKEDWMLLCMLLHMRSSSSYEFLRVNNILPLPAISTIRKNLAHLDTKCGFDPRFFEIFREFLSHKEGIRKHGLLLIDEMSTRESVGVKSKTLSYTGLVDFGEDHDSATSLQERANHGLVFMFRPLADSYTQPIAVFASRGPTKGIVLAKLIVKAIIMLENSGAKIHGVVTDGAAPNRKFWSEMGLSGKKHNSKCYFLHPIETARKVYAFSDTPHLMKTIRNRLYTSGSLRMDPLDAPIQWEHFRSVYNEDKKNAGKLRCCPKITDQHLKLDSCLKMRVNLAVQIFSKSMADSLMFYKSILPELKDCDSTANFCLWINNLFDALNRGYLSSVRGEQADTDIARRRHERSESAEGVKPGEQDFKIVEEALKELDAWETRVEQGILTKEDFLTDETAQGLRMTLSSTLCLITDLTKIHGFQNVYTGNINQDPLERFFGTVRQAGGSNDHPATPTFLQIYKILSLFNILKPPKTGNCTILNDTEPLIKLKELKAIYAESHDSQKLASVEIIKQRLINAVKLGDWNVEDHLVDHDYAHALPPEVIDCIMFYVTEYICNKLIKANNCETCLAAVKNPNPQPSDPRAKLLAIKNPQHFIHPNENLFKFVTEMEKLFTDNCMSTSVYERVIDGLIQKNILVFPCEAHGSGLLSAVIHYYVRMRMHGFSSKFNREKIESCKSNQTKKKIAKLCKT